MIDLQKWMDGIVIESASGTTSNKERLEELRDWLKAKKYKDYVKTLNKMLEDPKARTLLVDGFGAELGDVSFKFSARLIKAAALIPTQVDIDVEKSLKRALTQPDNIDIDFTDRIVINNMPIVTFRGNYVIDGHHRWSEAAMVNPDGRMLCFDYDADMSVIQFLKAVQGSIAAVYAEKREKGEELPLTPTKSQNIYDDKWTPEKISKFIEDTMTDEVCARLQKHLKLDDKEAVVKQLTDNITSFRVNNPPVSDAQKRGDMPQTDKASVEKGNKKESTPYDDGSALNKLKDGKFDKKSL